MVKIKVAVLGTEGIGGLFAKKFSEEGFNIYLWDKSLENAKGLAGKIGADAFQNPWAAIERADAAISILPDEDTFLEIVSQMRRSDGLLFINSTTISPKISKASSKRLKDLGICYVEAQVLGDARDINDRSAIFLVAGENNCVRYSKLVLSNIGSIVEVGEEAYKAMIAKLAIGSVYLSSISALSEAINLAKVYGIEEDVIKKICDKTPLSSLLGHYFGRITSVEQEAYLEMDSASNILEYASRAAFDVGFILPTIRAAGQLFKEAEIHGYGKKDFLRIRDYINPKEKS
ncbi:MAG: NAD(P)-binding domain-containing protein [Caldisphaeraceae archaeon]|nr:NAD(P)-binding domain-containing protein [Caldisphaeraceae archaeon]